MQDNGWTGWIHQTWSFQSQHGNLTWVHMYPGCVLTNSDRILQHHIQPNQTHAKIRMVTISLCYYSILNVTQVIIAYEPDKDNPHNYVWVWLWNEPDLDSAVELDPIKFLGLEHNNPSIHDHSTMTNLFHWIIHML